MKLVTIQTKRAYDSLLKNGYLIAESKYINKLKYGVPYQFVIDNMQNIDNRYGAEFPLWVWVKYGSFISPPKNKLLGFFPKEDDEIVKIIFKKPESEVLVSDYVKYHFLLTNQYLPTSITDKQKFDQLMQEKCVADTDLLAYIRRDKYDTFRDDADFRFINEKIQSSYQCIFETDGKYQQGTVWYIAKDEIISAEIIKRENCTKKKPVDYRKMYIKSLKQKD